MSGRVLYEEDYLNFLRSIFEVVQLMKEVKQDCSGIRYHVKPPHYGNLYSESSNLTQQRYKEYIDNKYKERFIVSFKAEDDYAVEQLVREVAYDIFDKENM